MTPKQVRDWIRQQAKSCPCCGAAVLIRADTDAVGNRMWAEVAQHEPFRLVIVSAEEAEADIIAQGFELTGQSAGGRVRDSGER